VRVDLHCHTDVSDGVDSPASVGARASARVVELFALTDHDTCGGYAGCAAEHPATIRAVEISCDHAGRTVHVLAYDAGGAWHDLEARLERSRRALQDRLRVIGEQLARLGVRIDIDAILVAAGPRAVGRPDLARAMVAQKVVKTEKEAFRRYLYDRGPGDAPGHRIDLGEALALGRAVGARMSLAHPHQVENAGTLLRKFRDEGLGGVEAFYGVYSQRDRGDWIRLADELGLVCTAGSDRHTSSDLDLGIDIPADRGARLREWLGR
jgi:predicted metal-dependent phosphoesterase TrpH